jgi:hypothetical protein
MRPAQPVALGFSPLDEELGLSGAQLSPWLVEATVRLGTWMPFERVPAALAFFTGVQLHAETARRLTEDAGAALVAAETEAVAALEREQPDPPLGPAVQQVSADGAMVPLVGGAWAEAKTVAIGRVVPAADGTVRSQDLSYFSRLADHETFARLAWGELYRRGTTTAGTVLGVMDGSDWLQGFLAYHRPDAVRILDFPHAVEHLAAAAQATFGPGTAATCVWLEEQRHTLRHGDPAAVLAALRALPTAAAADPASAAVVRDATLAYLTKRWSQIQYATFSAQGYPIGSGMVESANKLVVEARLKGSGMHWARRNVDPLLALRNAACSDRWAVAWSQRGQQQRDRRAAGRRCRWAAKRPPRAPAAAPGVPMAVGTAPPALAVPGQPAPRVPQMVNGHPTKHHPWNRFGALRSRRYTDHRANL